MQPYIQNVETLSQPIIMHPPAENRKVCIAFSSLTPISDPLSLGIKFSLKEPSHSNAYISSVVISYIFLLVIHKFNGSSFIMIVLLLGYHDSCLLLCSLFLLAKHYHIKHFQYGVQLSDSCHRNHYAKHV